MKVQVFAQPVKAKFNRGDLPEARRRFQMRLPSEDAKIPLPEGTFFEFGVPLCPCARDDPRYRLNCLGVPCRGEDDPERFCR